MASTATDRCHLCTSPWPRCDPHNGHEIDMTARIRGRPWSVTPWCRCSRASAPMREPRACRTARLAGNHCPLLCSTARECLERGACGRASAPALRGSTRGVSGTTEAQCAPMPAARNILVMDLARFSSSVFLSGDECPELSLRQIPFIRSIAQNRLTPWSRAASSRKILEPAHASRSVPCSAARPAPIPSQQPHQ